jgi:hypothetical protein
VLAFVADENFNQEILRIVAHKRPDISMLTVQQLGLAGTADSDLLEWAAVHERIMLTHDVATMRDSAYQRVLAGEHMPGLVVLQSRANPTRAADDIIVLAECSYEREWEGQVIYLPL